MFLTSGKVLQGNTAGSATLSAFVRTKDEQEERARAARHQQDAIANWLSKGRVPLTLVHQMPDLLAETRIIAAGRQVQGEIIGESCPPYPLATLCKVVDSVSAQTVNLTATPFPESAAINTGACLDRTWGY